MWTLPPCPITQRACPFLQLFPLFHSLIPGSHQHYNPKTALVKVIKSHHFLNPLIHFHSLFYAAIQQHLSSRSLSLSKILPSFGPRTCSLISFYLTGHSSGSPWFRPRLFAVQDHSLPSMCPPVTVCEREMPLKCKFPALHTY